MISIFYGCRSLSSFPEISKWNTNNVFKIKYIFYNCRALLSFLSDISKWITNNVTDMSESKIFEDCELLPDFNN